MHACMYTHIHTYNNTHIPTYIHNQKSPPIQIHNDRTDSFFGSDGIFFKMFLLLPHKHTLFGSTRTGMV